MAAQLSPSALEADNQNAGGLSGYNERLFGAGFRGYLHLSRFRWVAKHFTAMNPRPASVVELGCFDGKILSFLPSAPARYLGFDANWEGGLDLARAAWRAHPEYEFRLCTSPQHFSLGSDKFDIGLCMETLEHLPADQVGSYLKTLAEHVSGKLLVTVPNETGIVFLFKHLSKRLSGKEKTYSLSDMFWLTLGRTDKVTRNEHKGFGFRNLLREMSQYFEIEEVEGLPLMALPPALNFTVGIVARPRR